MTEQSDKLAAREHARAAGLPVLPGGHVLPDGHALPSAGAIMKFPEMSGAVVPDISRNDAEGTSDATTNDSATTNDAASAARQSQAPYV